MGVDDDAAAEGLIYICVEEGGAYAKVGWASSLERARMRCVNHQIGNPRALTRLILGAGDRGVETALHDAFRDQAVRGEWFRVEGPVAEAVELARPLPSVGGGRVGRPPTQREAAQQWLVERLSEGPLPAGQVFHLAGQSGHSAKTLRRAAADLGVIRTPAGGGRRCSWRLPAG